MPDTYDEFLASLDADEAGDTPEVDASAESGQAEAEGAPTTTDGEGATAEASEESPQPQYVDLDALGDQLVRVKVNGEEFDVPLRELPQGYQRQADYTRGKQRIAYWETFEKAAAENPELAFTILAQQMGVDLSALGASATGGQAQAQVMDDDPYGDDLDPQIKAALEQIRAQYEPVIQHYQQDYANRHLESVLSRLEKEYADLGFDRQEMVRLAFEHGVANPDEFELLYQSVKFPELRAKLSAVQDFEAQRTAADQQRVAAAAAAAAVTHAERGTLGVGATEQADDFEEPMSLDDAIRAALREQGFTV